ncbi:fos-related antigen 1-like isoform X2 [Anneissia japonica]|uniref:fos-related antigen 1-like isoform X2 n=1 Tax=Anneissia japonica TaxID=1529436 RepID=UPI0014254C6B|nr:fos-related antigen 1-like isoform X2 [Anneissia japonica]
MFYKGMYAPLAKVVKVEGDYTASEDLMDISTFSTASTHTTPPTTQNAIPTSVITPTSMGHWAIASHDMHGGFVPPAITTTPGHIQTTATPHIVTARSQVHGRRSTNNKNFAVTANDIELLRHSPSNTRRRIRDEDLSKDERDKRKVRRERNKVAAAKCRQRRVDHTNYLVQETEEWEESNATLEQEISKLQQQKEQLEFILEAHRAMCKINKSAKEDAELAPTSRTITTSSLETPTTEIVTPTASVFSFSETCATNTVSNGVISPTCGSEMIKVESSSGSEMSSPDTSRTLLQL